MSILITGGTGFIGTHLARQLLKRDLDVVLFDICPDLSLLEDVREKISIVTGDLASRTDVFKVVKEYDVKSVYHCGALLSESAEKDPSRAFEVNTIGTWHVLEASRLFGIEKVVFTSTIAAFGNYINRASVPNEAPQFPITMYGVTKVCSERLGEYYHRKFGVDFRAVRFPSVIGPGRGPGGVSAYTTLMIQMPALEIPYDIFVHEDAQIPILYVKDAVRALILIHEAPNERLRRRVYNIEGVSPTAKEIAEQVGILLPNSRLRFRPVPEMVKIVSSWPVRLEETAARKEWVWEMKYSLSEIVKDFVAEVRSERDLYLQLLQSTGSVH